MRWLAAVLLLVAGAGVARAAEPVYDSPAGGFAFIPPPGWQVKKETAEPFPTLSGPADDLRAPYVVIQAIADKRDVFTFGDAAVKEKLKDKHFELGKRDDFETAAKEFGVKFVFTVTTPSPTPNTPPLVYQQAYYIVQGPPGTIYVFLATVPAAGWEKYQPALDDMMRSYHLRPVVAPSKAKSAPSNEKK